MNVFKCAQGKTSSFEAQDTDAIDRFRSNESWVKDGKPIPKKEQGAKLVHFPPHWMISWPFNSKTRGFPDCQGPREIRSVREYLYCRVWLAFGLPCHL